MPWRTRLRTCAWGALFVVVNGGCEEDRGKTCAEATCESPRNAAGQICPGVCAAKERGCTTNLECLPGHLCLANASYTQCLPGECEFADPEDPTMCGGPETPCGECVICTAQCGDRVCGPDPLCGKSCGECEGRYGCSIDGQCVPNPNVCEGELSLVAPAVEARAFAGEPPQPTGGGWPTGTFDLVEALVYPGYPLPQPRREALLLTDSGLEQVLAGVVDPMPFRRLMTVSPADRLYTAVVDCPKAEEGDLFEGGYSVSGSELWLLGGDGYLVYERRAP